MSIQDTKERLLERINTVAAASDSLEDLSYASAALAKLAEAQPGVDYDINPYVTQLPGRPGAGLRALRAEEIPAGYTALPGHDDVFSHNFANYLDNTGSHVVMNGIFWFKWSGNTPLVVNKPTSGYVLHEAFRWATIGFFRDKCHVSNVGGVAIAKLGETPLSTSAANNPISALTGTPPNTYLGMLDAIKARSADHHSETCFEANALAIIALAHSAASTSTVHCAYKDVLPYLPKGNNNNALGDANDSGVRYTSAGNATYPACALTGSGFPFAKTTHNGQACGVADVNGNMWRVNIGMTKANATDGIFQILKTTVNPNSITSANVHDAALYDDLDLTGLIDGNTGWTYLGNGANQVFSEGATDLELRQACAGIPLDTGVSVSGTDTFGSDGFYRYWRLNMLPISGGNWSYASTAGVFARALGDASSYSGDYAGGSACVTL